MKKLSLFLLIMSSVFLMSAKSDERIAQINKEIQELQSMKRGYEARALKQENMVEYQQFNDQTTLETRRLLQISKENREKARIVQERIDALEQEKAKLLGAKD
jgi:hypothetical protein